MALIWLSCCWKKVMKFTGPSATWRGSASRWRRAEGKINFVEADLTDQTSLDRAMQQIKPDEVYNLAGQSFVPVSWNQPLLTMEVTGMGALRMLEAIRRYAPAGQVLAGFEFRDFRQTGRWRANGVTRVRPRNPYGAAKMFAHHITINYRESYGMFACSCIAFNHESPRRGLEFVTRKVHGKSPVSSWD